MCCTNTMAEILGQNIVKNKILIENHFILLINFLFFEMFFKTF